MEDIYQAPAIQPPSVRKVQSLADKMKLDLRDDQLEEITECLGDMLKPYDTVYRMIEPKPPVKYPRTPGYRPSPEENKFNAWYVKTDIRGAGEGKLAGKTVAMKDNISVAGVPMMNGTKLLEGYIPSYDATVVTRVLDAGGHITGKAACENFCYSGNSFTNDIGPVLNPLDPTRTSGGSSSGSGALLAAGEVDLAIGGDQGGSIRIPSSWCGTVGLKPTFGLIPYTGACSYEHTLDHLGPMARTVADCALLLEVLAGYDGMDDRQPHPYPVIPEYSKQLKSDIQGMKIAILTEGFLNCEKGVAEVVRKAAEKLRTKGAVVEDISIPMHSSGSSIWTTISIDGTYETIVQRAGFGPSSKGFHDANMMSHLTQRLKSSLNELPITLKLNWIFGEYLKETTNHQFYSRGANLTMKLTEAYEEKFKDHDVIVMPTLTYTAPKLPSKGSNLKDLVGSAFGMCQNVAPINLTGHPALSINAGFAEGLPVGMMLVGKKWHELELLNVAYAHEELSEST